MIANTSNPMVSVIIVSYNTGNYLSSCLSTLRRHSGSVTKEIIVIDNASTDGTSEMVRTNYPECRVVELKTNVGYGTAVNIGSRTAEGNFLLLLNPDVEVGPGSLEKLVQFASCRPDAGVIGPRLLYPTGQPQASARRFLSPFLLILEASRLHLCLPRKLRGRLLLGTYFLQDRTIEVPWVSGACHLIPLSVWRRVGPLTEETFCGSDDYDYCYRVRRLGYKVWLCSQSSMTHYCSVAVRNRWSPWDVEQLAIHNFYVVLEIHWPQWRVKTYMGAEIVNCATEIIRNRLMPRMVERSTDQEYGKRLHLRLRTQLDLLLGRIKPIRRYQPSGLLSTTAGL
jgi:N-acetylglucosaminyl-diphospho-decaprenol L-rhamnosyltransferase